MDIIIDDRLYKVNNNYTVFQYCAKIGINLPCFCYHERLSIAGNCRICIVEVNNALVVSCATSLLDNMNIITNNDRVKKAREGIMEFLLVNHPLDCPICDQGGECDLQDIALVLGSDRGRFYELNKRSVTNLNCCGPFIKTIMTRCIHCTRCIRFVNEISSIYDLGVIGRGLNMEIGTYILNFINDELLGNVIDLCPVGALTAMPSSFVSRSWETKYIQSIDILDSIASGVKIGVYNNAVIRILPSLDEFYDEWITNKARFVYDSFNIQRLKNPKLSINNKFIIISWKYALYIYIYMLYVKSEDYIYILCGPYMSLDLAYNLKYFFNSLGCSNIFYYDNTIINSDFRYSYLLNITVNSINSISTLILLGLNPRLELPLLNSMIRKNYLNDLNFKVYSIGVSTDYITYPVINIGSSIKYLYKFFMCNTLSIKYLLHDNYYNIYYFCSFILLHFHLFVGNSVLIRDDNNEILDCIISFFMEFDIPIKNFNVIYRNLGKLSFLEVGISPSINLKNYSKSKICSFNYLLGIDNFNFMSKLNNNFNIFQGFYNTIELFKYISLILPTSIYIEKNSSYINLEGRYRYTNVAILPGKYIHLDTEIIEAIFILFKKNFLNNFSIIQNFYFITKIFDHLFYICMNNLVDIKKNIFFLKENIFNFSYNINISYIILKNFKLINTLINRNIYNYYNEDIFCRMSKTLNIAARKIKIITFENDNNNINK